MKRARVLAGGFTLVEVLVALFVMALMAGLTWQGIDGISRTRNASQLRLDQTLRINTILAQWEQDLIAVQDVQSVPPFGFDGGTLRIIRTAPEGLQVVAWSLRGRSLMRWSGLPQKTAHDLQESWFASQQLVGNEPRQLKLLDDVLTWQLYCYRGNSWSNCQSSGDVEVEPPQAAPTPGGGASAPGGPASGPPPQPMQTPSPQGVRLVLTLVNGEGTILLTRDIAMGPQL